MNEDEKLVARMADLVELAHRDLINGEEMDRLIALARIGAAVKPLVSAAEEFIRKVDVGKAKSVHSYAQFKSALSALSQPGPTP